MADKQLSTEEKKALLLDAQLETQLLTLDQTRKANQVYTDTEEQRQQRREQAQLKAKNEAEAAEALQRKCKHQAGVRPNNIHGKGVFGSGLTASKIFFSWNWLIQCIWCGLKNQTPHPSRKNRKPQEIRQLVEGRMTKRFETQAEVKARVEKYEEDLKYHNELLEDAQGSGLDPMVGPQFEFQDQDGMPAIPVVR